MKSLVKCFGRRAILVEIYSTAAFLLISLLQAQTADLVREWIAPAVNAPRVERHIFDSVAARTKVSYFIYTPPAYDIEPKRRFPVLYWLHGGGISNGKAIVAGVPNLARFFDAAIRDGKLPAMVIVFPNGLDSLWIDSKDGSMPMETIVIKELMPLIDASFRTIRTREARMIEGFSMGGYGAAHLGFLHSDLFSKVSILSAGPLQREFTEAPRAGPRGRDYAMNNVFGGDDDYFKKQSPWVIASQQSKVLSRDRTRIRLYIGDRDEILANNRLFEAHLKELQIPHAYREVAGVGHNPIDLFTALGDTYFEFYRAKE